LKKWITGGDQNHPNKPIYYQKLDEEKEFKLAKTIRKE